MNRINFTLISLIFFLMIFKGTLYSQIGIVDTLKKNTFIEANISINSARNFNQSNLNNNIFLFDTISYSLYSSDAFELQARYTKDFSEQFSWYGGIAIGRAGMHENIMLRDSVFDFRSPNNSPSEFISIPDRAIYYASLSGGLRVSTRAFKNDRIYFNLGGKLSIYPKKDLSFATPHFSQVRNENIIHNSSSTLDNQTKLNGSMEIDISYHLITKNEKYRFIAGVLVDRSEKTIFNITNEIILPDNIHTYEHSFSGIYVGAYIGFAYIIESKTQ